MSSSDASIARIPSRTTSWSSTSITRRGGRFGSAIANDGSPDGSGAPRTRSGRERRSDGRPFSGGALDLSIPPSDSARSRRLRRPMPQVVVSMSNPRPSSSISRTTPPSPRRSETRQVVASACRLTFESASRASCTTSPAREASTDADLAVDVDDRHDAGARIELARHLRERLIELPVGQDPGPQTEDVVAEVSDRADRHPPRPPSRRRTTSASAVDDASPWRLMPTANSDWITPSWSSFPIRSRSSITCSRWSSLPLRSVSS